MGGGRAILAAVLSGAIAGCGAGSASSPPPPVPRGTDLPSVAISPATASPTEAMTPPSPSPSPTPQPTPKATPVPLPPKPTGVTFTTDSVELPGPTGTDEITYQARHTVRWQAPRSEGVEIRVYGVTECLSEPHNPLPGTSGPCLLEHTLLSPSVRVLAATAPAAAGEISWVAPFYYECGGPPVGPDGLDYQAIVIAAYNSVGHSIFAIADPGGWQRAGPGEVVC
jgi:hypothetical protein